MGLPTRERIREIGQALGFARIGFASTADELPHLDFLCAWVKAGLCGELGYLRRDFERRGHPTALLPSARTAIVVLAHHGDGQRQGAEAGPGSGPAGQVARFARGPDYHVVLRRRLLSLVEEAALAEQPFLVAVDSLPLLERELAAAAGLGFIGKNTLLITPGLGSYTSIGVLLTSLELPPDPRQREGCGRCRLCLDACPTGALVEPRLLDARRCVACLTVEQPGLLPEELLSRLQPWVFGCDRCQEVCPFNARPRAPDAELSEAPLAQLPLLDLLSLRSASYRRLVRGRALRRASRLTLQRNAALLARPYLGGAPRLRAALEEAARSADPGLRQAATWSLRA